jgi:hypothetical protein
VAGRLALEQHRFDDAAKQFSQVTPEADQWLDANFMQAATAREAAARAAGSADTRRGLWQQALNAIARVQPVLERGAAASASDAPRQAGLRYYLGMLRVYRAEATLALGQAQQAIDALVAIEDEAGADTDVIGEAMKVRINAFQELRRPDEALRDLQRFVQNSPAQAGAVLQPMLASLRQDVQALVEADRPEEARELASRALLPAARTLETWLGSSAAASIVPAQAALLWRYVADADRLAGQCEVALLIYERLLEGHPNSADLLLGRAECLFELGGEQRLADAMAIYKRLGAAGSGTGESGRETWWLAQLRMLQILDQTKRNTQQILPRIERLRQGDANFGGERYRRGFEALRAKYASSSARPA